jgi:hypothetical protein
VTDPERDHFVQQIRDLERRLRRSHLVIVVLAALLLIPLVGAGLFAVVLPPVMFRAEEAAARARAEAEAEAARQKQAAEQARQQAEKAVPGTGRRPGTGKE